MDRWSSDEIGSVLIHHAGHLLRDHAGRAQSLGIDESVWARGIALVDGSLVLGIVGSSENEDALHVVALRWSRGSRENSKSVEAPALVSRGGDGDGEWILHWV